MKAISGIEPTVEAPKNNRSVMTKYLQKSFFPMRPLSKCFIWVLKIKCNSLFVMSDISYPEGMPGVRCSSCILTCVYLMICQF